MYQKNQKKKSYKPYILGSIALLVLSGLTLFFLENQGITNFYNVSSQVATSTPDSTPEVSEDGPTNNIDYGPTNPVDDTTIPEKNPSTETPAPTNAALAVTITSTRKNTASTAYLIKAVVAGASSGTCNATLSKGQKTLSTSGVIALSGGQYSCMSLEIPTASVNESGVWDIQVTATDSAGATASTSTTMEVIL